MKNKIKSIVFIGILWLGSFAMHAQTNQSATPTPANASVPVFANDAEKQQWINEHQAQYNLMNAGSTQVVTAVTAPTSAPVKVVAHADLPAGFPVYVNTGNNDKDNADYMAAKLAWIAAHPKEYADLTNPK